MSRPLPWYREGLKFSCTGCGRCCTGSPGYTWVSLDEIEKISTFLQLPIEEFSKKYIRKIHGRYSLLEKGKEFDCIFLENKKCTIYPVRPKQCKTFPFWPSLLESKESWQEASKTCEGISEEAPLVPLSQIEEQLK